MATVFLARPTGSRTLLSQMIGRGMRGPRAGGTKDVRVVSFDDHWQRFPDWLDPVEFLNAPITDRPDHPPVRPDMVDVPWPVYLEIARLVHHDPGQVTGIENRPVGWYDLSALPVHSGGMRTVVVFHSQRDAYDGYLEDLLDGSTTTESAASLIDWYFSPLVAQPSPRTLDAIRDFVTETAAAPPYFAFETMDRYGPETVADRVAGLSLGDATDEVHRIHEDQPVVRALFPDRRLYAEAVFDAILDRRFGPEHFTEHTAVDLTESSLQDLPAGTFDLEAIAAEVSDRMGLDGELPSIDWSARPRRSYWAIYYENPREITVNCVLKTKAIKPATMGFLIYHELLHHHLGVAEGHSSRFRDLERQFPDWFDAEAELDTLEERFRVSVTDRQP